MAEMSSGSSGSSTERTFGKLVAKPTGQTISNTGTVGRLSSAQATEASGLYARLEKEWNKMFMDKNRIESELMRLDQQSFFNEGTRQFSNIALQNNTAAGSRDRKHTHTYASVFVDTGASKEKGDVADAMQWALQQSQTTGKIYRIDAPVVATPVTSSAPSLFMENMKCVDCKKNVALPMDLLERSRVVGCYPPVSRCPGCVIQAQKKWAKESESD